MRDGAKILKFHDAKIVYERRWDAVWKRGDFDSLLEVFSKAVDALEAARHMREGALRRQLWKAREQLDERGGHIKAMDTVDLTRAMHFELAKRRQTKEGS